jgi:hypothetical protein
MAIVVSVYLAYSSFGVAAPFFWGHHGYHGATYMQRARMTLRFHMVTPATWAGYDYPPKFSWYFHHPIGYHHLLDLPVALLGAHEWIARGLAALGGLPLIFALYVLVRRWWSREAALLASAVYVALPVLCSFSILSDPMLLAMACCIGTVDCFLRYFESPSRKRLFGACALIVVGGLLMWEAYFQALFHAMVAFVWSFTSHGKKPGARRAAWAWILGTGVAASATMAFHLLFTRLSGMDGDFTHSFHERHNALFSFVVERHRLWMEILYGWPLVAIGVLWLMVFVFRVAAGKARFYRDQAVLIFFQINTLYIFLFAEGSSIHLYRVFWYSSFFALAVTDLIVDLRAATIWILRNHAQWARRAGLAIALAATGIYFAKEGAHAWDNLIESRVVMGTHGLPAYNNDYPKLLFAMEVASRTGPDDFVLVHGNMPRRIEFYYYMDRSNQDIFNLNQVAALWKQHPKLLVMTDAYPAVGEKPILLDLLKKHPGDRYDRYVVVDLRSDKPGFRDFEYRPQPMSFLYRWLISHKYPPLRPEEVTSMYAQCVDAITENPPHPGAPAPIEPNAAKDDLVLCHHNYEVLRGATDSAAKYLATMATRWGKRDGQLGDLGSIVALRVNGRTGVDVWTKWNKAIPDGLVARWKLVPASGGDARTGNAPAPVGEWPMTPRRPGYLAQETAQWSVVPGKYHLIWEYGKPLPPAPMVPKKLPTLPPLVGKNVPVVAPGKPVPVEKVVPPAPPPPPPVASVDLGEIVIR